MLKLETSTLRYIPNLTVYDFHESIKGPSFTLCCLPNTLLSLILSASYYSLDQVQSLHLRVQGSAFATKFHLYYNS